jgi:hypothetical protein
MDGAQVAVTSQAPSSPGNSVADIGASLSGSSGWLAGSIDEVRLYNRALSASEVASLYNLGK